MLTSRRILVSCANKYKLVDFWKGLNSDGFQAYASDGTYNFLKRHGNSTDDNLKHSDALTSYSKFLDGKVKTMHPNIFTGILADPNCESDQEEMEHLEIQPIDIVCVNLYPVEHELKNYYDENYQHKYEFNNPNLNINPILAHTDIGGSALIRAACKNYANVLPVVDPSDYDHILYKLELY